MSIISAKLISLCSLTILFCIPQLNADDSDLGDHPKFAHAMQVETREVDGFPVVFHYGQVRPDFSDNSDKPYRKRTSLYGEWSFRFDPDSKGIEESWFLDKEDAEGWQEVIVPHCWDAMDGSLFWEWSDQSIKNPAHYNGSAWYKRSFEWKPNAEKKMRQRIAFLSVQQRARVYLNGKEIAMHEGGGAPFSIDVTDHLTAGSNTIALKVTRLPNYKPKSDGKGWDELRYVHTMHPKAPDCWPYAGILRSVSFIEEPEISIRKTQLHTSNGKLHAAAVISNHGDEDANVTVILNSSAILSQSVVKNEVKVNAGQTRVIKFAEVLSSNIIRWSPETPTLYKASVSLKSEDTFDQLINSFGVREFTTEGPNFMLNGKPIFLKGASVYGEHIDRGGAITKQDHKDLFKLAIDSKCNFLRLHVTQRDPYAYKLADELGILVCGEWGGFWYEDNSMLAQTKDEHSIYQTMGRCAVWDLMNHPSVVLWGLHNESHQYGENYSAFIKMGQSLVREIDTVKRPITWAAWHPYNGDPNYHLADAVGFNEYRGTFDPFEKLDPDMKKTIKLNPNKPLIILENGAWAPRGKRGPVDKKDTEDWQADLLKRQWKVLSKHSPAFAGYTYWLLTDYRSRKPYTGRKKSNGYSRMGLYDEFGKPKLVKDVFRDLINPLEQ